MLSWWWKRFVAFRRVQVELHRLMDPLPLCVSAQQGVACLRAIHSFLDSEREIRAQVTA